MLSRSLIPALLLAATAAFSQAPNPAPESVRIVSERKASGPDLVEWVHTLDCRADGGAPSLRVTLGNLTTSASAGIAMTVGANDRATGTITVRVLLKDKATRTCAVTVEVGAEDSASAGQTVRLPPGQDLTALADLKLPSADAQLRRAIALGSVGGCMLSAYVMPGRSNQRSPFDATPPPGDPAVQAAETFRSWARAVKSGELEAFAAVVPPNEWKGMDPAQRTRRLQEYQEAFKTVLGEGYNPDDFKIDYAGGPSVGFGKLKIRYGDKELPALGIRYFGGKWVLLEP
jgi:hypothetical protein